MNRKARRAAATYAEVLEDILRRDRRDTGRAASPLQPAADAFLLDTSNLDIEAAFNAAVDAILGSADVPSILPSREAS